MSAPFSSISRPYRGRLTGAADPALPPEAFDAAARKFDADYEVVRVPRAGHFLHREAPELFNAEVVRFLG